MKLSLLYVKTLFLFCVFISFYSPASIIAKTISSVNNSSANNNSVENDSTTITNPFSKITYSDVTIANKILISLHHSVLEINRDEKYLIATLNEDEKSLLIKKGLIITPATAWQVKFQQHQKLRTITSSKGNFNKTIDSQQGIDNYQCYPTVEETYQQAEALAEQYPQLTNWLDIGDSWNKVNQLDGYDLMVLKITNKEFTSTKPILFIHSSMHAREYAPAALNLDFAKWLLNNYSTNAEAQWLVNHREIHLLFHMNPDGRKIAESQILQRKNSQID